MPGGMRKHSRATNWLSLVIPACALGLAFGPDQFPLVTLRAFLIPCAALLVLFALWMFLRRSVWLGWGSLLAALIVLFPPVRVHFKAGQSAGSGASLSIAHLNIQESNRSVAEVVATALASDADVISIQEVNDYWAEHLVARLSHAYPWHIHGAGERNYGIALFSKTPLEMVEVFDLEGLPAIRAVVLQAGRRIQVIAVHLRAPESAAKLAQRNAQWKKLKQLIGNSTMQVCVLGDLNTVPWDAAFQQFLNGTSMHTGPYPLLPTWPSLVGSAVIPLDHILVSSDLRVVEIRSFAIPGSDHRGLRARVQASDRAATP